MDTAAQRTAVSYARLSENDGTKVGIVQQERLIRKAVAREGLVIGHALSDDDRSAYKTDSVLRSGYQRLLELIRRDQVSTVVVKHADRLHRSVVEAEQFADLARKHGVVVVTSSGVRYLLDTADGEQAFTNAATQARFESRHRGERVADSHEERAISGKYRGGGRRPFGWGVVTTRTKDSGLSEEFVDYTKHNPAEVEEIRRWKRELLSGVDQAQVLRSISFPTVTGKENWEARTIQQILTNPRTSGHSVYRGEIVARDVWPAIISDDEREALKALFADPNRKTTPGNTPRWLGSMIFRCGKCDDGTPMTCRNTNENQRVYRCQIKGHCQRDAVTMEAFVEAVMVERLSRDDVSELITARPDVDVAGLQEEKRVLHERKKSLALKAAAGTIDDEMLAVATADIRKRLDVITEQLKTVSAESPLSDFEGVNDTTQARDVWDSLTLGRKREVLRYLADITLLPIGRGRRPKNAPGVDPASVRIDWRKASRAAV